MATNSRSARLSSGREREAPIPVLGSKRLSVQMPVLEEVNEYLERASAGSGGLTSTLWRKTE